MATAWCTVCGRETVHLVFDKRLGGCTVCVDRRGAEKAAREATAAPAVQERLF
jgi:hypothetical protein